MKTILFYSPYMGYTGSEVMIKYIVNCATRFDPVILSGERGKLLDEIKKEIPVYVLFESTIWNYRINKLLKTTGFIDLALWQFKRILQRHKVDLVVVNTIIAEKIIPFLKKTNIPFVLYAHELPPMYDFQRAENLDYLLSNSRAIIGCSQQVCNAFKNMGLKNINLFYECIDVEEINNAISQVSQKNDETKHTMYFVMSGQRGVHKGFHLAIEVARFLKKFNAALVWLGQGKGYGLEYYILKTKAQENLDNLILPGLLKGTDYYSWLMRADAFLLTSMVDPYPLVMLEAAYLQKPIIAFDSGGVKEFVSEGMGKIVPYYCVNEYLKAIEDFINGKIIVDKELLRKKAMQHDIKLQVENFEKIVLEYT